MLLSVPCQPTEPPVLTLSLLLGVVQPSYAILSSARKCCKLRVAVMEDRSAVSLECHKMGPWRHRRDHVCVPHTFLNCI